jgi:NAD(P)-dependent dehydrogenase (short-subunit alcohol dehydrogenase family)
MKVAGSIALVTGANRGLGLAFARALKEMGAAKVCAAARNPGEIARTTLDALERGECQVLADEISGQIHRGLSADPPAYFQSTAALRSGGGLSAG